MTSAEMAGPTDSEKDRVRDVEIFQNEGTAGVHSLIQMLAEPSWVVRRSVVQALAAIGDLAITPLSMVLHNQRDNEARIAAAVDALVASSAAAELVQSAAVLLSKSPDPAVAADAVQILGRRRNSSAIPTLIQLSRHFDDNVAVGAIEALGRIGGRAAVEALIAAVGTGSFFRTFPAIDVLGRSGDPRAVEPLAGLLTNPNYQTEAARALGRTGEKAAVRPLLVLLKSQSDAVVRVAAQALRDLHGRFEEKSGGNTQVIEEILRTHVGSEEIRQLTRVLATAQSGEAVAICELLGAVGNPEAAPGLGGKLDSPSPVAETAAEALKKIGPEASAQLLQAIHEGDSTRRKILLPVVTRTSAAPEVALCLKDPDPEVRALACDTLARLGNGASVAKIFPLLGDRNLRVVHSATAAIQALGNRESRDHALEAFNSENPVIRRSALRILAYFGDEESLKPMLDGLSDSDPRVRESALQGLPYLEDPLAVEALYESARSSDSRVRALAVRSLGSVVKTTERTCSLLLKSLQDSDAWVRYYGCQSSGRLFYTPAAKEISALLQDEAGQVRVSAIEALSHLDSPIARSALREGARSADVEVKRAALVGLGIAHRPEDLPVILSEVTSTDVATRLMALSALASFNSPLVLETLGAAGSDPEEQVRSTAMGYLAARPEQAATELLIGMLDSEITRDRAKQALSVPNARRVAGLLVALDAATDEMAPLLVSILSRTRRTEARGGLLAAIKLNNAAARKAAAASIAAHADPEMSCALRDAAENDPDPEVRQICSLLLRE